MQTFPETRQESPVLKPGSPVRQRSTKRSLADAFRSFANVAGSLESFYAQLQSEVARLRRELERANRDLNQSLEENKRIRTHLSRTLECLPCGVLVVDGEHKLKLANSAALSLLGTHQATRQTAMGVAREVIEKLELTSSLPAAGAEQEWPVDAQDGQHFLAVSRTPLSGNEESAGEWILILRDITASKRLEKEREAARRTQDLAQMAMLLAHEIRNPLGSLELFAGLLADATEERPVLHKWVEQVQSGLRTLSATVNNVLQFHSEPRSELSPVNLVSLLTQTMDFLQPLARQRSLRIDFSAPGSEVVLRADPHRLQQVFINLALNAFRAMSGGGVLRVSVQCGDTSEELPVRVVFRDHGVGIPSRHLARIFEAGFTTIAGSPGLGLALAKKVVEQHQGKISVESDSEKGTAFTLSFPRSEVVSQPGVAEMPPAPRDRLLAA
jgi:two-component system, sensor histidine kinase FlrB